jgi:tRNA U34 5-carboxymethylaminomethyl modifying GTPase MnmE/TrmE
MNEVGTSHCCPFTSPGDIKTAKELASNAVQNIESLLSDYRRGEILRSGVKLAIFGPPNAGKSSLLNLLGLSSSHTLHQDSQS